MHPESKTCGQGVARSRPPRVGPAGTISRHAQCKSGIVHCGARVLRWACLMLTLTFRYLLGACSPSLDGAASSTRSPDPRTAAASRADVYIPTSMGKGMMLDHLRVLRLSCRHHGGRRQCGGRGERAEVVTHLNSVVPPLPSSPIFFSFSAQIGCAEVVNGRAQFTSTCAPGRMDSPSILTISQELHLEVDALLLGVGAIVPTWESVRRSWGHHLRRNTRVRLIVM